MSREPVPIGGARVDQLWKRYHATSTRPLLRDQVLRRRTGDDWRWALRDINIAVGPGESVALIGLNGSGKSTLLKLLTGVTYPYAGSVRTSGRIGALIEVRSGIHPDLTGRENIYFNGTVLGLTRRDVHARLDAMVEFAELEDAIDRQVKFYSSGMQMRLGFSVAAFLEPDMLLVDEALAVGDMSFQQRCLDRMRYVLEQGTTLMFVSHDMSAVEAMCRRSVWLDDGVVRADGPTPDVLGRYRIGLEEKARSLSEHTNDAVRLLEVSTDGERPGAIPQTNGPLTISFVLQSTVVRRMELSLGISEGPSAPIFVVTQRIEIPAGRSGLRCELRDIPLPRGRYYLWAGALDEYRQTAISWRPVAPVDIEGPSRPVVPSGVMVLAPVHVESNWRGTATAVAEPDWSMHG